MKKEEKIAVISNAILSVDICRCYFQYDQNYFYYYPNAVNERFLLGQEEDDFLLDGYCIRKISHLKKVEVKDDKCNAINRFLGVTDGIAMPEVDITSWQTIFESLSQMAVYIEIENAFNGQFAIGKIIKVFSNRLYFSPFGSDGVWDADGIEIRYAQITSVKWGTRYAESWRRFLEAASDDADKNRTSVS